MHGKFSPLRGEEEEGAKEEEEHHGSSGRGS